MQAFGDLNEPGFSDALSLPVLDSPFPYPSSSFDFIDPNGDSILDDAISFPLTTPRSWESSGFSGSTGVSDSRSNRSPTPCLSFIRPSSPSFITQCPSSPESERTVSDILDDPGAANEIVVQSKQARQRKVSSNSSGAKSRRKTLCKRTRATNVTKSKEQVGTLQKQVEDIVQKVKHLGLVNKRLELKTRVLNLMIESMEEFRALVNEQTEIMEFHKNNPAVPPTGAALYKDMTAPKFIANYRAQVAEMSQHILEVGMKPIDEINARLHPVNCEVLRCSYFANIAQPQLLFMVKAQMLQQFPLNITEDEHWLAMISAMEITPGQHDFMLVAREVFTKVYHKMNMERELMGNEIGAMIAAKPKSTTSDAVLCADDDEIITRLASNMHKQSMLIAVMCILLYNKLLTPLQVSRLAFHSLPLMPSPIILLNAAAAFLIRQRQEQQQQDQQQQQQHDSNNTTTHYEAWPTRLYEAPGPTSTGTAKSNDFFGS